MSSKKVIYLNNLNDTTTAGLINAQTVFEAPIQKNDLLSIAVGGSNLEDLILLNSGKCAEASEYSHRSGRSLRPERFLSHNNQAAASCGYSHRSGRSLRPVVVVGIAGLTLFNIE